MVKSMFFEPFRYPLNPQLPNPKALDPRSLNPKSMNNSAVSWLTPALPPTRALAFALARALARLHPRDRSLFLVASLSLSAGASSSIYRAGLALYSNTIKDCDIKDSPDAGLQAGLARLEA